MKKRRVVAAERIRFRYPGEEKFHVAHVTLFEPYAERPARWVCEFDMPGFVSGDRGYGHGTGPVTALAAAGSSLRFFLDRVVDVSSARGRPGRDLPTKRRPKATSRHKRKVSTSR